MNAIFFNHIQGISDKVLLSKNWSITFSVIEKEEKSIRLQVSGLNSGYVIAAAYNPTVNALYDFTIFQKN